MEEVSFQEYATTKQTSRFPKKIFLMLLFLLVLVGVGLTGYGFFTANTTQEGATISPTETPSPTPEPTATPGPTGDPEVTPGRTTPTTRPQGTATPGVLGTVDKTTGLDRSKLTVQVLNGSGVSGAAKGVSDVLTKAGYTVSGTGNADSFDYENVVIQLKSSKNTYLNLLKKDLGTSYTIGSTSALAASSATDAVVIIGKDE